jgi:hypothetical protein
MFPISFPIFTRFKKEYMYFPKKKFNKCNKCNKFNKYNQKVQSIVRYRKENNSIAVPWKTTTPD